MTSRGLMTGRFQPFHSGHLALAKQILAECDELVIIIGSAQFNFIDKDPFTAGERVLMIHEALKEGKLDISKCYVIPVPNDENNARWIAYLRSMAPPFDVLYSGNDLIGAYAKDSLGAWEMEVTPGGDTQREKAIRLGVNLAMYALCLDYKEDQVHIPFIMKRRRI